MIRPRMRALAIATALAVAFPILVTVAPAAAAEPADCNAFSTDLYQLVKPSTGASLLTSSTSEADAATARYGFTEDEGTIGKVATRSGTGLVAVWRLYKWGDFVWATDGPDAERFRRRRLRQTVHLVLRRSTADSDCVSPIQRLSKDGMHRMTPTSAVADLEEGGWTVDDGAVFYATTGEEVHNPTGTCPAGRYRRYELLDRGPPRHPERERGDGNPVRQPGVVVGRQQDRPGYRYMLQVGDLVNWGNVEPDPVRQAQHRTQTARGDHELGRARSAITTRPRCAPVARPAPARTPM